MTMARASFAEHVHQWGPLIVAISISLHYHFSFFNPVLQPC